MLELSKAKAIYKKLIEEEYSVVTFSTPPESFKRLFEGMPLSPVQCEKSSFSNRKGVFLQWIRRENGKYEEKWGMHRELSGHPFTIEMVKRVVKCCYPEGRVGLSITMYFFRHDEPVEPLMLHRDGAAYVATFPIEVRGFKGGDGHIQLSDGKDVIVPFSTPGVGYIANDRACKHGATALTAEGKAERIRDVFIITVNDGK